MATELGETGSAIWSAYGADKLDAGAQSLIRELARCADTLDRLDDLASGRREGWVLLVFDDMGEIHLSIDKILDERRNHQLALRAIHSEIRQAGIRPAAAKATATQDEEEDMLTKRRREREERERKLG